MTTAETTETTMATTEADGEISADYNDADIMFAQMMIPPSPAGRGVE
ncbi:hypothetical protein [Actinomyces sp. oral taxon 181]|nr:hypothetical protein [Actinomyces sp. oral taxon 181]EKY14179.1 hypothetical protein HMPREF9061_01662 [Actinomyces sp. oral taxon 181 str. F0379]